MTYHGSPWRSRFLRGPKIGLELARRDDFVELGDPNIAIVKLGLKTGADKFFYAKVIGRPTTSRFTIRGLNGWEGDISRADLIPSLQSPKELDTERGRLAVVPTRSGRFAGDTYYFAPRPTRLDGAARDYVAWGEQQQIQDKSLVKSNSDGSAWFRQSRAQVRSRWALPYNSGYDYGAVDNDIAALLNGRFVGVEPATDIDPDLLGGILNSSTVTLMRLLEGVATGNEGAFDVGPPAARVMRIPDPRQMTDAGKAVREAFDEIRAEGVMPPSPSATGEVSLLRRNLDLAVLISLGMSRGEATVLIDRIYTSYARWRKAVEAVEDQMQIHRKALARRGGTREENPVARSARTVWDEIEGSTPLLLAALTTHESEVVDPIFPSGDDGTQFALFGGSVVPAAEGGQIDLRDQRRVDLARRIRDLGFSGPFPLPTDASLAQAVHHESIAFEATTRHEIERRASVYVSMDLVDEVVAQTFRTWVGHSFAQVRRHLNENTEIAVNGPDLFQTRGLVPPLDDAPG